MEKTLQPDCINTVLHGDALAKLKELPDKSVHCCVTSPPYWNLRNYGVDGQIGLEDTTEEFIERLVAVFREVKRVLVDEGTIWVNMGDSYASAGTTGLVARKLGRNFIGIELNEKYINDIAIPRLKRELGLFY